MAEKKGIVPATATTKTKSNATKSKASTCLKKIITCGWGLVHWLLPLVCL